MPITDNKKAVDFHQSVNSIYMDICEPLRTLGIKDYSYFKCLPNGEYLFHLSNFECAQEHMMTIHDEGEFYTDKIQSFSNEKQVVFMGGDVNRFNPQKDPLPHLAWRYDFWNHINIYRVTNSSYVESWAFSLGKDHADPLDFFLKRMDLLERFIAYFDNAAQDITQVNDHNKYAVFNQTFQFHQKSEDEKFARESLDFIRQTSLKKITFNFNNTKAHLTKREGQCLYFLLQNYTAKEIAQTLDISPRTVEVFLSTVKEKLGKFSKLELANFVKEKNLKKPLGLLM